MIGTTPTHTFTLPFDVSLVKTIKVIYAQKGVQVLCKRGEGCQLDGKKVVTRLTQEETFLFDCRELVQIQLRILTNGGDALKSKIMLVRPDECFDNEVLT